METPPVFGDSNGPHNSRLCEGCKAGHCSQSRDDVIMGIERCVLTRPSFGTQLIVFQVDHLNALTMSNEHLQTLGDSSFCVGFNKRL